MLQLTTTQIAARLGVSERTAYRWIERGVLRATRARRGNKYSVDEKDLDALARNEPDELAALTEKYEHLAQRLATLEQEVAELRAARTTRHAPPRAPAPSIPVGPGDMPARTFAERHGLTKEWMNSWIKRGEIETTPRAMGQKTQHMLTPEQQARVVQFWRDSGIEYTACPDCPHEA